MRGDSTVTNSRLDYVDDNTTIEGSHLFVPNHWISFFLCCKDHVLLFPAKKLIKQLLSKICMPYAVSPRYKEHCYKEAQVIHSEVPNLISAFCLCFAVSSYNNFPVIKRSFGQSKRSYYNESRLYMYMYVRSTVVFGSGRPRLYHNKFFFSFF